MYQDIVAPFIRYVGGKGRMLSDLFKYFPTSGIDTIVDCFGGSGIVAVNSDYPNKIYCEVNAVNLHIYNCLSDVDYFDQLIIELLEENHEYTKNVFDIKKDIYYTKSEITYDSTSDKRTPLQKAKDAFIVQLWSWNGSQKEWKGLINGYEKIEYLEHLKKLLYYKERFVGIEVRTDSEIPLDVNLNDTCKQQLHVFAEIYSEEVCKSFDSSICKVYTDTNTQGLNMDECNFFKNIKEFKCNKNAFLYIDPPYVFDTREGSKYYAHELSNKGQVILLHTILNSKAKIMVSGYDNMLYDMYLNKRNGWRKILVGEYFLGSNVTVGVNHRKKEEYIWVNY